MFRISHKQDVPLPLRQGLPKRCDPHCPVLGVISAAGGHGDEVVVAHALEHYVALVWRAVPIVERLILGQPQCVPPLGLGRIGAIIGHRPTDIDLAADLGRARRRGVNDQVHVRQAHGNGHCREVIGLIGFGQRVLAIGSQQ